MSDSRSNQINNILQSLCEMLSELSQDDLNKVEDLIVNEYDVNTTDENDNYRNLFIDILYENEDDIDDFEEDFEEDFDDE